VIRSGVTPAIVLPSSAGSKVWGAYVIMEAKEPPRLEGYTQRDEEIAPDVFEVSGSVKWFDPSKGYGFIVTDEDLPEVLLHVTCLRRGGFQTACEGTRVVCKVVRSPNGLLQAVRICSMDDSTAIRPSQLPQRTHVVVVPEGARRSHRGGTKARQRSGSILSLTLIQAGTGRPQCETSRVTHPFAPRDASVPGNPR